MIAGHSSVEMTEQYTFIELGRQDELTQAIQKRLAAARQKGIAEVEPTPPILRAAGMTAGHHGPR